MLGRKEKNKRENEAKLNRAASDLGIPKTTPEARDALLVSAIAIAGLPAVGSSAYSIALQGD